MLIQVAHYVLAPLEGFAFPSAPQQHAEYQTLCQSSRNPKNTIPKQALQSSALPLTQKVTSYTSHFCQKVSKMPLTFMLTRAKNSQAYPEYMKSFVTEDFFLINQSFLSIYQVFQS